MWRCFERRGCNRFPDSSSPIRRTVSGATACARADRPMQTCRPTTRVLIPGNVLGSVPRVAEQLDHVGGRGEQRTATGQGRVSAADEMSNRTTAP